MTACMVIAWLVNTVSPICRAIRLTRFLKAQKIIDVPKSITKSERRVYKKKREEKVLKTNVFLELGQDKDAGQ